MAAWINSQGPEGDVALSSRARLARNYPDLPFPIKLDKAQADSVLKRAETSLEPLGFKCVRMDDLHPIERKLLVERHVISPQLSQNAGTGSLITDASESCGVMINEEDHLRIQAFCAGFAPSDVYSEAQRLEEIISKTSPFAFDGTLGYLTSCPTNVGTGLRVSVMLHLPALSMLGYIAQAVNAVSVSGMTVRGIYGEGSDALGALYQISNQITLGKDEDDIVELLGMMCRQIMHHERELRGALMRDDRLTLEDKIMRSWGVFTNARKMSSKEFMQLWSDVRMGVVLEIIKAVDISALTGLMVGSQPAALTKAAGRELTGAERDEARAGLIRKILNL